MNQILSKKNVFIAAALISSALIIAGGWYVYDNKISNANDAGSLEDPVNYDPPTEEEQQAGDAQKAKNIEKENQQRQATNQTESGKKKVTPVVSFWGQNPDNGSAEANGFVTEAYEEGGTCTLTLQKDGQTKTARRKAIKDAQTTTCGLLIIPRDQLNAGKWQTTITYSSATAYGVSDKVEMEIK